MKEKKKSVLLAVFITVLIIMILILTIIKIFYKRDNKDTAIDSDSNMELYGVWVKTGLHEYKNGELIENAFVSGVIYDTFDKNSMTNCLIIDGSDDYCEYYSYNIKENNVLITYNFNGVSTVYSYTLSDNNSKLTLREDINDNYYLVHYFEKAKG